MPLLAASATLLLVTAALPAWRFGRGFSERYWLFVAAVALQLGALSLVCSALTRLEPATWIAAQTLLLAVLGLGLPWRPAPGPSLELASAPWLPRASGQGARLVATAAGGLLVAFLLLSALLQATTPVSSFDDRMYHASRAAYWMQHQSIFPWESHNDRQVVFSFGSELFFFWPVLLTRVEAWGRMAFWLGFPAAAFGLVTLLGQLRAGRALALAGAAAFAAAPMVWELACGLSPELWLCAFCAGTAFWAVRAVTSRSRESIALPATGLFLALAMNAKLSALALAPAVALVPFLLPRDRSRARAALLLVGGGLLGAVCSGLAVPLVFNTLRDGHPLGSRAFREVHESARSLRQLAVHAARAPFLLFEVPMAPAPLREGLERAERRLADATGATRPLPLEDDAAAEWPGRFTVSVAPRARRFSLPGAAWLLALVCASAVVARRSVARGLRPRPRLLVFLLAASLSTFGSVVLLVRWMPASRVPERFLPFALVMAVVTGVHLWGPSLRRSRGAAAAAAALLVAFAVPSLVDLASATRRASRNPPTIEALDAPYEDVAALLPAGSRVLLVGSQNTPDYPLFAPRDGYSRSVVSWGKHPIDLPALVARVVETQATHVLLQDQNLVVLQWDPPLVTQQVTAALRADRRFHELPNRHGPARLFRVVASSRAAGVATPAVPCSVGLGAGWYGLERDGARWWRWSPGGGRIVLYAPAPADVRLQLEVRSLDTPNSLRLVRRGTTVASIDVTWAEPRAVPAIPLRLEAGVNELTVVSANRPRTAPPDTRPLAVGIGGLQVSPPLPSRPCEVLP